MRVGIWCAAPAGSAAQQQGEAVTHSWEVELPEGWFETCVSLGFAGDAPAPSQIAVAFAGGANSPFQPLRCDPPGASAVWAYWGLVPPGRYTLTATLPAATRLTGLWVSNGPLPHGWPGNLPALSVDDYLLSGQVRPIPQLPGGAAPLEYAQQGLATHLNQQGAMGVADGLLTAVPRALRLRYVDAELHFMLHTEAGPRRPKEVCADFELGLLDGDLLCPVATFTYDEVAYTVTFAAVPQADQAADGIFVRAENRSAQPRPNRLVAWLDSAADVRLDGLDVIAGGETLAYLSEGAEATVKHRALGCADLTATTAGDMYSTPFLPSWGQGRNPKYDVAFYSARIGWDGRAVGYRLACPPGAAYTVYLGVFDTKWGGPGQKVIYAGEKVVRLSVEGSTEPIVTDVRGQEAPTLARFEAQDTDGNGFIDITSAPDPATPHAIGFLNAVWVFPANTQVDLDDLRFGALNTTALHFANVGGSLPGGVVDLVLTEDWSFAYVEVGGGRPLAPHAAHEWQIGLPVNHRADQLPYSQARYWREPGEGTPAYADRLAHRHAAARLIAADALAALGRVRRYWADELTSPARYLVPDPATRSITRTSLAYFISHRVKLTDDHYLPIGGGPMYYFDFSERDCGYGIVGLDLLGRHADTERLLNPYLTRMDELNNARWALGQDDQGMWMTRAHEEDTQGQVLWALGEHFMLTRDLAWLRRAWPRLKAGLDYIRRQRAVQKANFPDPEDPRHGLWISGTDESKSWGTMTHSYYFNYWIECGLRLGVLEAEAVGETDYAQVIRAEHSDFLACLYRSLSHTFWRIDYRRGALPNAAESPDSTNPWGVQEALYPSQSISIWDPMVAQTIAYCDALAYPRAGGLTLGPRMLWPSAACDFGMMHLRRGEGDRAVDIYNSMIATCGLVNTWGETIYCSNGLTTGEQPYTWANACFLILQRQLLIHESGDWLAGGASGPRELWLSSATPRKWLADPAGIEVNRAPTYFGPLTFTQRFDPGRRLGTAQIELTESRLPERLIVHFRTPLGSDLRRVTVNGVEHPYFSGEKVFLAQPAASLEIKSLAMTLAPSLAEYPLSDGYVHHWLVAGPRPLTEGAPALQPASLTAGPVEAERLSPEAANLRWRYVRCGEDHLLDVSGAPRAEGALETWASFHLETDATISLKALVDAPTAVELWVAGQPIAPTAPHTFQLLLAAGVHPLVLRFERPAGADRPNALRLQLQAPPGTALRVRLPISTTLPQNRAEYETALDSLYLDRAVFTRGTHLPLRWTQPHPGLTFTTRFQTPDGVIFAEAFDVRTAAERKIQTPANLPEGAYQVLALPDTREFHDERRLRVTRALPVYIAGPTFASAPTGEPAARRQEALTHAARQPGQLYAELAKMALGLWSRLDDRPVRAALDTVAAGGVAGAVAGLGLLGVFSRFGSAPEFPTGLAADIERALRAAAFDASAPVLGAPERLLLLAGESLSGQAFPGAARREQAEADLLALLRAAGQEGVQPWHAPQAIEHMVVALAHLLTYSDNETIGELASVLLDQLFYHLGVHSFRGVFGVAQGRATTAALFTARLDPTAGLSWLLFGLGTLNRHLAGLVSLLVSDYELPPLLADIAAHQPAEAWSRERQAGVNLAAFKTPDYMLSAAQDYAPGQPGRAEHVWQATFGPEARVFTTHPANVSLLDVHQPNFWRGNAALPRVAQWRETLLAIYQASRGMGLDFTHAYFPTAAFDEYVLRDGWAFARVGDGYLALTAAHGLTLTTTGDHAYRELRSPGRSNVWVCQLGRAAVDDSFAAFQQQRLAQPCTLDPAAVRLTTGRGERLTFGWQAPFTVNDSAQPLTGAGRYDHPYTRTDLGAATMEIVHGDQGLRLSFA